ncbi:hypothetical protein C0995_005141 [Termitomyces sp. Mi166|nr:hypothetical protein C0995_005141 [Termitomyces sp. Mi166\
MVANGQAVLDDFKSACEGASQALPSLTLSISSTAATGSLPIVPETSNVALSLSSLLISDLPLPTTPIAQATVTPVTVTVTSMSSSTGFTPLNGAPSLVFVGVFAGIVLALM